MVLCERCPKLRPTRICRLSTLYSNGDSYAELGAERRETITSQEVPQLLEDAIVSVEDKRFYKHIGVDPIRYRFGDFQFN